MSAPYVKRIVEPSIRFHAKGRLLSWPKTEFRKYEMAHVPAECLANGLARSTVCEPLFAPTKACWATSRMHSPPCTAVFAPGTSGCSTLFPESVVFQLAKRVLPANEIVDDDASLVASRAVGMVSLHRTARTDLLLSAVFHGAKIGFEIPMGLPNSCEQGSGSFDQELDGRDAIQDHTPE